MKSYPTQNKRLRFEALEQRQVLTTLMSGQEMLSDFVAGSIDAYDIDAENGDIVRISIGEVNAFGAEPNLEVFAPGGQLVASDVTATSTSNTAEVQFEAIQEGVYSVLVSDASNNEAMSYRIRSITLPSQSASLIPGRDSFLDVGEETTSDFPAGSFNYHLFSAENDDIVRISIGELGNLLAEPNFRVYSPNGQLVASDLTATSTSNTATVQFEAIQSGVYSVLVTDASNNEAMSYRIRSIAIPSLNPVLIPGRDSFLNVGQEITSDFPSGSFNLHQLLAKNSDIVRISIGELGSLLAEPNLQIYSPGGQLVASDSTSTSTSNTAEVQFEALQSGVYSVLVSDASNNEAMNYRIRSITLPPVNPQFLPDRDSVLSNNLGEDKSFPQGSYNFHLFSAVNGDNIRLSLGEITTFSAEPNLRVYSPGGQLVASDLTSTSTSNTAEVQFEAIQSGVYSVLVTDASNNEAMSYRILGTGIRETTLPLAADFDQSGTVGGSDFLTWQRGSGANSGALVSEGDANNDGAINALDLDIWHSQYGISDSSKVSVGIAQSSKSNELGILNYFLKDNSHLEVAHESVTENTQFLSLDLAVVEETLALDSFYDLYGLESEVGNEWSNGLLDAEFRVREYQYGIEPLLVSSLYERVWRGF